MEFRCLGPLEVRGLDGMPIDLIDSVWGESPPDTARKTIQGYVSALRKVLPAGSTLEPRMPRYLHP